LKTEGCPAYGFISVLTSCQQPLIKLFRVKFPFSFLLEFTAFLHLSYAGLFSGQISQYQQTKGIEQARRNV
jgi:hypothetical protein